MNNGKRRFIRLDALNLLDYVLVDDKGDTVAHAMGRTLNISENGILLETHIPLASEQMLYITVGLEEDLVDLKGQVKHSEPRDDKYFNSGIEFLEIKEEDKRVLLAYLKAFQAFTDR